MIYVHKLIQFNFIVSFLFSVTILIDLIVLVSTVCTRFLSWTVAARLSAGNGKGSHRIIKSTRISY